MTAAASLLSGPQSIGSVDMIALKALRNLTERHVSLALSNITASASAADFIDLAWIDQFGLLADDLWSFGITTVDDLFRLYFHVPLPPTQRIAGLGLMAVEEAKETYLELLNKLINKYAFNPIKEPVVGEFITGNMVQYGDVRELLVKLGGGPANAEIQLQGGITTGRYMTDYLREAGIESNEKIWLYGWEEQPRRTFNGHLQMDGLVFEHWDDNALIIAPQDIWLRRNYYAPGDHWGCACVVAPYFPNFGEPFKI